MLQNKVFGGDDNNQWVDGWEVERPIVFYIRLAEFITRSVLLMRDDAKLLTGVLLECNFSSVSLLVLLRLLCCSSRFGPTTLNSFFGMSIR